MKIRLVNKKRVGNMAVGKGCRVCGGRKKRRIEIEHAGKKVLFCAPRFVSRDLFDEVVFDGAAKGLGIERSYEKEFGQCWQMMFWDVMEKDIGVESVGATRARDKGLRCEVCGVEMELISGVWVSSSVRREMISEKNVICNICLLKRLFGNNDVVK
jgi:hypothetical protein